VSDCEFDWQVLRDNVLSEVDRLDTAYTNTLDSHGVDDRPRPAPLIVGPATKITPRRVAARSLRPSAS
jgi:hypothetical protein